MNDSTNPHGVSGSPENDGAGDERTTPSSPAPDSAEARPTSADDQPTVPQPLFDEAPAASGGSATTDPDGEPTQPAPTAHTLPYITGGKPAHLVTSNDDYQAYDPSGSAHPGSSDYATAAQSGFSRPGEVPPAFGGAPRRSKRWLAITGIAAAGLLVAGASAGGAYALAQYNTEKALAAGQTQTLQIPGSGSGGGSFGGYGYGQGGTGTFGGGSGGSGSGSGSGTGTVPTDATAATAAEKVGLVTIVSTLNYDESSKSAGTGMIMTSDGEILTNNHVVQGSTSIQVTVESTGKTYTADVVGTDATNDVAVLKLQDASGLQTVSFAKSASVASGDQVHSTGNAEGTGSLVTAEGTVLATKQSITVQSDSGSGQESLSNLIEISADVVSGDSGGPLRNADGKVIGIVTAASSGTADVTGYAIPIATALSIADKITAGESSSTIVIGLPAFLGAEISSTGSGSGSGSGQGTGTQATAGVPIAGTVTGSAAAKAGLVAGDTITAVGGTPVADASALTAAIRSHQVGDRVTITYTDSSGASQTVTVTLGSGPAA